MSGISEFIRQTFGLAGSNAIGPVTATAPLNMTRVLLDPKNILIIPYNRMGTTLMATRVFKAFREHYASASIAVAVHESWSVLISNDPAIDRVIAFGDDIEHPSSKEYRQIGEALAEQKFDLAFYLSYQFDPVLAYLTRLSEAALRVSFQSSDGQPYFNIEIVPASGNRYEGDRYIELLHTLGINGVMRDYTLKITDSLRDKARMRYLAGLSDINRMRLVGFDLSRETVGDSITRKTAEQVITVLLNSFNATVIVVYEPEKRTLAAELKELFGKRIILIEDRPVSMVAGLMSFCRFMVTLNTDLFQLAVALKQPTVGILTDEECIRWSPGESDTLLHLTRPNGGWPSERALIEAAKTLFNRTKSAG